MVTMNEDMRFFIHLNPAYGQYELHLYARRGEESSVARGPITMYPHVPGAYAEPLLRMEPESAQVLMDELWRAGLRPNNGEGGPAQVEAMRQHLADMRAIVAKELEVDLR